MLLTDKEIEKMLGMDWVPWHKDSYRFVAKTQIKKVVELLNSHTFPTTGDRIVLSFTQEEWQQLLKEIDDNH